MARANLFRIKQVFFSFSLSFLMPSFLHRHTLFLLGNGAQYVAAVQISVAGKVCFCCFSCFDVERLQNKVVKGQLQKMLKASFFLPREREFSFAQFGSSNGLDSRELFSNGSGISRRNLPSFMQCDIIAYPIPLINVGKDTKRNASRAILTTAILQSQNIHKNRLNRKIQTSSYGIILLFLNAKGDYVFTADCLFIHSKPFIRVFTVQD